MKTIRRLLDKSLYSERNASVDTVVIHAMSAINVYPRNPFSIKKCIEIFIDYEVSAHYIIDRKGRIYHLVPEEKKAWHAGVAGMNDISIGIELMGSETVPFEEAQYAALNSLIADIKKRHKIKSIVGHQEIKESKWDPGKMFDWKRVFPEKK